MGCTIWPMLYPNQYGGSSLLCSQHATRGLSFRAATLRKQRLVIKVIMHDSNFEAFYYVCVLLGNANAVGHRDGTEWRADPLQVSKSAIREENAATHIKFSQVLSSTCQVMYGHICHLRQSRRKWCVCLFVLCACVYHVCVPWDILTSAVWPDLCSKKTGLWRPGLTELHSEKRQHVQDLSQSCTTSALMSNMVEYRTVSKLGNEGNGEPYLQSQFTSVSGQ